MDWWRALGDGRHDWELAGAGNRPARRKGGRQPGKEALTMFSKVMDLVNIGVNSLTNLSCLILIKSQENEDMLRFGEFNG